MQPNENPNPASAQAQPTQAVAQAKPKTVKDWLSSEDFKSAVKAALPAHMTPERFVRVALTCMMRVPKLQECSQHSLFKAMLDCSSLGLEPDGRRAHLIPYGSEVQLIIDYKGLIELGKRSGEVKNWRAELVCEKDEFAWENGQVHHKVNWLAPRGKVLAVYSHVRTQKDVDDYEVMTLAEVEEVRKRSKAGKSGPWVTDFNEMAKKTVIRRHSKRLTLSPEFMEALEKDADRFEEIPLDLSGQVVAIQKTRTESVREKLVREAAEVKGSPSEGIYEVSDEPLAIGGDPQ
jgi:recombination protein RecT